MTWRPSGAKSARFKVEEISVYCVHRSFFLWALILTGFVGAFAVHHHGRPLLWGWVYRFEAYTPAPKRQRGYYALPLLWRDQMIGWGNVSVKNGELQAGFGYVDTHPPRDRAFRRELEGELDRMRTFLGLQP